MYFLPVRIVSPASCDVGWAASGCEGDVGNWEGNFHKLKKPRSNTTTKRPATTSITFKPLVADFCATPGLTLVTSSTAPAFVNGPGCPQFGHAWACVETSCLQS